MKIKYENQPSDITAYGELIYEKSPTVKQHRRRAMNFSAVMAVIFALVIYYLDTMQTVYIWLILSMGWLIFVPTQHKRRYLKNMVKTYEGDKYKNIMTSHELTADESGLTDQIENGINHTTWSNIEHIEETEKHLFIFVDSTLAYAVPKDKIQPDEYRQFTEVLKEQRKKTKKENKSPE